MELKKEKGKRKELTSMKKFLIPVVAVVLGIMTATPVLANHIYVGKEVEKVITYDENGNKVITLIFDPAKTPDFMKQETENTNFERVPLLTEAPEVGTTLGHILNENASPDAVDASRFMEAYQSGLSGQCTWYAAGRFREIYGIELPNFGDAKNWIVNAYRSDKVKTITDLSDVPEQSIAVYEPTEKFATWAGHVSFVEYVERDKNGNPVNIYYTDANGVGDLKKDEFNAGYDGTVKVSGFEDFKNPYGLRLIGYIIPAEEMENK